MDINIGSQYQRGYEHNPNLKIRARHSISAFDFNFSASSMSWVRKTYTGGSSTYTEHQIDTNFRGHMGYRRIDDLLLSMKTDEGEEQETTDVADVEESDLEPIWQCEPDGSNVALFFELEPVLMEPEPYESDDDSLDNAPDLDPQDRAYELSPHMINIDLSIEGGLNCKERERSREELRSVEQEKQFTHPLDIALPLLLLHLESLILQDNVSSSAWFMSYQETSFVTISQRLLSNPLRVRFHYGHPDVFDRLFHITRGGISKASKTINLSEDVFAGCYLATSQPLDFTSAAW
ncbi:hypothetical protein J1N35_017264 [Gossypium stocksii]|uniref:Glycosyl transferase 48 domain-containing protein n=1 Tax=Gossypium stocksii TaxID=47602 RepID=A0A9D4A3W5_9ROSI|nr:hypothetical protein J1N35_017264 [Gossypium stocksii]